MGGGRWLAAAGLAGLLAWACTGAVPSSPGTSPAASQASPASPAPAESSVPNPGPSSSAEPAVGDSGPFPRCDELPRPTAPADWYRDQPVYIANEMPIEAIKRWARDRPGYTGIWIDRDHNGWVTVAFTEDAEARQAELLDAFPGVGVVAVEVTNTKDELRRLRQEIAASREELGIQGYGISQDR